MKAKPLNPTILAVGVFDFFHYGHLRLFQRIKSLYPNSWLIVAVQDSAWIRKFKPDADIAYSTEIRRDLIASLRPVDEVIIYETVDRLISQVQFAILPLGEDQNHSGFMTAEEYCRVHSKLVFRLPRTPGISSPLIKKNVDFHNISRN